MAGCCISARKMINKPSGGATQLARSLISGWKREGPLENMRRLDGGKKDLDAALSVHESNSNRKVPGPSSQYG